MNQIITISPLKTGIITKQLKTKSLKGYYDL